MAGLVIGKLTGEYALAVTGAAFLDLDHLMTLARHGLLSTPRKFLKAILDRDDPYGDQRYIFHNFLVFVCITLILVYMNTVMGFIFGAAYASHILLDGLDNSDYYPFFPNKKINIRGPITYFSKQEFVVFSVLTLVFFLI
jgi:membrane-bound metal-dependent hydrolase YbcI (DUF457 family)